jgi:hypothetical protein
MDVVGIVLSVVVLDQKCGALQPIVVRLTTIQTARPGEVYLVHARLFQTSQFLVRDIFGQIVRMLSQQICQLLDLSLAHFPDSQARRLARLSLA